MLIEGIAAAAILAGLAWIYHTRAKPAGAPRNAEIAKRDRFATGTGNADLRALRTKKGGRTEFGQR